MRNHSGVIAAAWSPQADPRTVLARETFASDVDAAHAGAFTSVSGGFIGGGRLGGPRYATNGAAFSGCIAAPTSDELSSGYTRLSATWDAGDFSLPRFDSHEISGWFRMSAGTIFYQGKSIYRLSDGIGNFPGVGITDSATPGMYQVGFDPGYAGIAAVDVPVDTWIWISLAWQKGSGYDFVLRVKVAGQEVQSQTGNVAWLGAVVAAGPSFGGGANQPYWAGRVGALQLSAIDSFSDCAAPPLDVQEPADLHRIWTVSPDGDDNSPNGPWQTMAGLGERLRDQTIQMRTPTWKTATGEAASYVQQPTSGQQEMWGESWTVAYENGDRIPQGDVVRLRAGEYRSNQALAIRGGISVIGESEASTILLDVPLPAVWTQPDTDNFPHVWRTDNPQPGCQVFVGSGTSRSVLLFCNTTDESTALAVVEAHAGSSWSGDADSLYVHAPGGVDPNSLTLERSATSTGGFSLSDGLIKNVRVIGACIGGDGPDLSYPYAAYHFGKGTAETIGVFDGCISEDAGKHGFANTGNGVDGLILQQDCICRLGPQRSGIAGFGFGTGGWTPFVDYSAATAGTPRIVSVYRRCATAPVFRLPNEIQGSTNEGYGAISHHYAHNNGSHEQHALILIEDSGDYMPTTPQDSTYALGSNSITLHFVVR